MLLLTRPSENFLTRSEGQARGNPWNEVEISPVLCQVSLSIFIIGIILISAGSSPRSPGVIWAEWVDQISEVRFAGRERIEL